MARVVVSLPDDLLQEIDRTAQGQHRSRGELLREAIERYLRGQLKPRRWEDPSVLRAVETQDRLARDDQDAEGDPLEEIRRHRESPR